MRTLEFARRAVDLGARLRTVCRLTGLGRAPVAALMKEQGRRLTPGRGADDCEWLFSETLLARCEASLICACFDECRARGTEPFESLLLAYERYRRLFGSASIRRRRRSLQPSGNPALRIPFDRAFCLVRHVSGLWGAGEPRLRVVRCGTCGAKYVSDRHDRGSLASSCPFCRAADRYRFDGWIRADLDAVFASVRRPAPAPERRPSAFATRVALARAAVAFGARPIAVSTLSGLSLSTIRELFADAGLRSSRGQGLLGTSWYFGQPALSQCLCSVIMKAYADATQCGVEPARALLLAYSKYRHVRAAVLGGGAALRSETPEPVDGPVSLDRALVLVGHTFGVFGTTNPSLSLRACARCGCVHLVPRADPSDAISAPCPFCRVSCVQAAAVIKRSAGSCAVLRRGAPTTRSSPEAHAGATRRLLPEGRGLSGVVPGPASA